MTGRRRSALRGRAALRHRALRRALPPPARRAASTSRRRQFEAMFLSLAHGDDEIDRDGRGGRRVLRAVADVWDEIAAEAAAESAALGRRAAARGEREREPVFSPLARGAVRARAGDDLRGLPRPLRHAAALRAGRRRHGAPARRLPLRARARPHRGVRRGRRGRRPRGADLALRQLRAEGGAATGRSGRRRRRCSGRGARRGAGGAAAARRRVRARGGRPRGRGDEAGRRARSPRTPLACGKFAHRGCALAPCISSPPRRPPRKARRSILVMLVVGLVFVGVIGIGELTHSAADRAEAPAPRPESRLGA